MAVFRKAPTCIKCGKQIKAIHRTKDEDFIGDTFLKWDYEGHVCSESRVRLLKLARDMKVTGLEKALTNPKVNQACEDIDNYGWILVTTDVPDAKEGYLPVTNGKEQWLGYYNKQAGKWVLAADAPFKAERIVAWTYNQDLSQLQECLVRRALNL